MMKRIIIVEDDAVIASGLVYAFEQEGYDVTHSKNVNEAKAAISTNNYDLAILDMQLPDGTGFEVRESIKNLDTAIIFLTIIDDEGNIVRAFESGADDYITKPFRLRELTARVRRTLYKQSGAELKPLLSIGNAIIDTTVGKVYINDALINLTALEYRLLMTFASNKGQILTRTQILENIWDSAGNFVEDNTLTVYIKRLREKLNNSVNIETIRGIGYRAD